MAVYVLLSFEDDEEAKALVADMLKYPDDAVLSPVQENFVHAKVEGAYKRATKFCECSSGLKSRGWTRGRKYGWWVCDKCGKPSKAWGWGNHWFSALGTNLIPRAVLNVPPEYRLSDWPFSPAMWNFLLPTEEVSQEEN